MVSSRPIILLEPEKDIKRDYHRQKYLYQNHGMPGNLALRAQCNCNSVMKPKHIDGLILIGTILGIYHEADPTLTQSTKVLFVRSNQLKYKNTLLNEKSVFSFLLLCYAM